MTALLASILIVMLELFTALSYTKASPHTGPTQCQDGVTNNCTQECTRDINTGIHNCSCYLGYQIDADYDTVCSGKLYYMHSTIEPYVHRNHAE